MPPARLHATPDLMALLCLIGGIVREAGSRDLLMPLLVIGTFYPPLGSAFRTWLLAEERYSTTEFEYDFYAEEDEDGDGGCDEIRRGWLNPEGPVLLWRHVDRFGTALLIPVQWAWMRNAVARPTAARVWVPAWLLSVLSRLQFLTDGLVATPNCVQFVPVTQ